MKGIASKKSEITNGEMANIMKAFLAGQKEGVHQYKRQMEQIKKDGTKELEQIERAQEDASTEKEMAQI